MATWEVTKVGTGVAFDTVASSENSCFGIDSTHFINFHSGTEQAGFVEVFTVDTTTWNVTTANASLEFDPVQGYYNSCYKVDTNHFINFWSGYGSDGFVQVFEVNTSTWAVTTANARLEFDTVNGVYNNCFVIDTNHFINFWGGNSNIGLAQVFTVNTTTWAVTTAGAVKNYDGGGGINPCIFKIDTNHFINFWTQSGGSMLSQVFTINTSTWAITTAGDVLQYDTNVSFSPNTCFKVDDNHFIHFWGGAGSDGFVQIFTVNTSTWAITTANTSLEFDTTDNAHNACYQIDSTHFINFWAGPGSDGFVQVFEVNTSTWAITTSASSLEFDTARATFNSCYPIDTNHFINFYASSGDNDGYAQAFAIELPVSSNIKTYNTNVRANIKTINTNPIANVKSLNTNV